MDFTQPVRCWEALGKSFFPLPNEAHAGLLADKVQGGAGLWSLEDQGISAGYCKQKCSVKYKRCSRRAWQSHRCSAKQKQRHPTQHSLILGVSWGSALQTSEILNLLRVALDSSEFVLNLPRLTRNLKENMIFFII